jgi:tetratricopeptide (TPR) repeat protein
VPPEAPEDLKDPAVVEIFRKARQAVLDKPGSSLAWGELGEVCHAFRYLDQAEICFTQAGRLDPQDRRWPYFRGFNAIKTDTEKGVRLLRRAAELSGTAHLEPYLRLAEALLEVDRKEEAKPLFEKALAMQPDCIAAHLGLARLAIAREDYGGSVAHLEKATEGAETRKAAYRLLALVYARVGRPDEAERARYRARHLPADTPWYDPILDSAFRRREGKQTFLVLTDRLHERGQFQEALGLARDLRNKYPGDAWVLSKIIRELHALGEFDQAKETIRAALARRTDMTEPYSYLGRIQFHEAAKKEAEAGGKKTAREGFLAAAESFRRVLTIKKDEAGAYFNLGHCYDRAGEPERALEAFRSALRCRPEYAEAHTDLADLLIRKGNDAEALEHLCYGIKLALKDDPKVPGLLGPLLARTVSP